MKKIAFFGTPPFTTAFLDVLKESGYPPSLVVTCPDRPVGRGMKLASPDPKGWADTHNIPCLQPEKLDDEFFNSLSKEDWDLFVVVAYGKIMPERIINLPKYGTINVHYSLLPKYRGATPVESVILHGDERTGVTIQQMKFKLDTGDILFTKEIPITETDTTPVLREKLNQETLVLLPEAITSLLEGRANPVAQDETAATHCTKIKKEDGEIDVTDDGEINYRKYRAYYGWPGSFFFQDGKRIKITIAHLEGGRFIIDEVIPENGKRMTYAVFLKSKI